jgi:hypothetical protein
MKKTILIAVGTTVATGGLMWIAVYIAERRYENSQYLIRNGDRY